MAWRLQVGIPYRFHISEIRAYSTQLTDTQRVRASNRPDAENADVRPYETSDCCTGPATSILRRLHIQSLEHCTSYKFTWVTSCTTSWRSEYFKQKLFLKSKQRHKQAYTIEPIIEYDANIWKKTHKESNPIEQIVGLTPSLSPHTLTLSLALSLSLTPSLSYSLSQSL